MANKLILGDCHTHLDHYPAAEIPEILERAREAEVGFAVCAGTTLKSTRDCIQMSEQYDMLYAGVGIHPMHADKIVDEETYEELKSLAESTPKVVCISEVGLDFLPESPDHEIQYQVFREHIRLARSLKLPVIFHSRESHPQVFQTLREEKAEEVGGVMHYFQGDEATAREAIDCGMFISLARPLLRLPELQEVAKIIPLDNIVLETDAAPQPFKSKRENWTEPRHVAIVAQKLAELKDLPVSKIEEATTRNMRDVLGDKWDVLAAHVNAASIL